jgi:hypothetical protein
MPTTSNFGWTTPADTDLVKDGAAAIRTLGNGVDTSFVDLKGGTTGQVLSKATNTDLDFTWVSSATGDITEVQAGVGISIASGTGPIPVITNSSTDLITTAGDLLYGTAADTVARLGIGTAGQVLQVNSGATAPQWTTAPAGMTLINTGGTALTGSSINIGSIPSTYRDLYIVVLDFDPSASGGPSMRIRLNSDNNLHFTATSATTMNVGFTLTGITIVEDCNQTTPNGMATAYIYDYANAVTGKVIEVNSFCFNSTTATNANITTGVAAYSQTTAISGFDIFFTSGTMDGGTVYVYGVK